MTSGQAERMVLVAGGIEAGFVLLRHRHSPDEGRAYKSLWAIGLLTLGLSIFADFVPEIAGPFALLVLVAMAARQRGDLGAVLGAAGATATGPSPGAQRRPSRGPGSPRQGE